MASATSAKAFAIILFFHRILWVFTAGGLDGACLDGVRNHPFCPSGKNFVLLSFATFPVILATDLQVFGSSVYLNGVALLPVATLAQT